MNGLVKGLSQVKIQIGVTIWLDNKGERIFEY